MGTVGCCSQEQTKSVIFASRCAEGAGDDPCVIPCIMDLQTNTDQAKRVDADVMIISDSTTTIPIKSSSEDGEKKSTDEGAGEEDPGFADDDDSDDGEDNVVDLRSQIMMTMKTLGVTEMGVDFDRKTSQREDMTYQNHEEDDERRRIRQQEVMVSTHQSVLKMRDVTPEDETDLLSLVVRRDDKKKNAKQVRIMDTMEKVTSTRMGVIIENPREIDTFYDITSILGEGAFGSVKKAVVHGTGAVRAVKAIDKSKMMKAIDRLKAEVDITKKVDHPNVIKLYEIFEDGPNIYLVMELCWGGELLDRIVKHEHFTETQTHHVMFQIYRAVYYLHSSFIMHRDMKPQNVLIVTKDPIEKNSCKITDFGMAITFEKGQQLNAQVGTLAFMAPEVVVGKYGEGCDVWSCGVIHYMCCCGYLPFLGKTKESTKKKILTKRVQFNPSHWKHVSEECLSLIHGTLRKNPKERMSARTASQHPWVKNTRKNKTDITLQKDIIRRLLTFRGLNKFKRAGLHLIVSLLSEKQTGELTDVFTSLDVDGDGFLDISELRSRLTTNDKQLVRIFKDDAEDGSLVDYSFTEFLAATFDRYKHIQPDVCKAAFTVFDRDGSGDIEVSELVDGGQLGSLTTEEIQDLVTILDTNGDGSIDFDEFMAMMRFDELEEEPISPGSPRGSSPRSSGSPIPFTRLTSMRRGESMKWDSEINEEIPAKETFELDDGDSVGSPVVGKSMSLMSERSEPDTPGLRRLSGLVGRVPANSAVSTVAQGGDAMSGQMTPTPTSPRSPRSPRSPTTSPQRRKLSKETVAPKSPAASEKVASTSPPASPKVAPKVKKVVKKRLPPKDEEKDGREAPPTRTISSTSQTSAVTAGSTSPKAASLTGVSPKANGAVDKLDKRVKEKNGVAESPKERVKDKPKEVSSDIKTDVIKAPSSTKKEVARPKTVPLDTKTVDSHGKADKPASAKLPKDPKAASREPDVKKDSAPRSTSRPKKTEEAPLRPKKQ